MHDTDKDSSNSYSKYYTYHNGHNSGLKMWYWNCYPGSYSECRDDQLVCSRNGRSITWDRDELYDTEYKFDDNLLCRCDQRYLYNNKQNISDRNY
jgi:hypothetical protein